MTVGALAGLAALNLAFAASGTALLFGLRGFRTWWDVLRLSGVSYLLGVAAYGTVWVQLLVVGVPLGGIGIVTSLALLAAAGIGTGLVRRVPVPAAAQPRVAVPATIVTAAGAAAVGLLLESLFRSARLQSLQAYDAWAFWVPKAKAIYFFGGLDEQVFTSAPGPSYPPLLPIVDATAFHAMGGADQVTLHVQFWFFVLGGVAAVAGCLHGRVAAWLLWPSLALVIAAPRFAGHLLIPQADVLVDLLVVVAALLVAFWVRDGELWRLGAATLLLAGAALTKREGLVFALCVLAAGAVASAGRPRRAVLQAGASVVAIGAATVPWRVWYGSHGIESDAPTGGGADVGRMWDALELSFDVLYSNALWSVLPIVATIALAAAAVWGERRLALYVGAMLVLAFLGGAWTTFGYPDLPVTADESVNPIVRYTGAIVLLAASATPLLLMSVWRGAENR